MWVATSVDRGFGFKYASIFSIRGWEGGIFYLDLAVIFNAAIAIIHSAAVLGSLAFRS